MCCVHLKVNKINQLKTNDKKITSTRFWLSPNCPNKNAFRTRINIYLDVFELFPQNIQVEYRTNYPMMWNRKEQVEIPFSPAGRRNHVRHILRPRQTRQMSTIDRGGGGWPVATDRFFGSHATNKLILHEGNTLRLVCTCTTDSGTTIKI